MPGNSTSLRCRARECFSLRCRARECRAPGSTHGLEKMRQTKVEGRVAVKILLQSTIGLEVITLCCLIAVPPTRCVDACLAVTGRTHDNLTICVQQATPYTCFRTCDCSTLYVEWSWTLQFGTQTHRNCLGLAMHKHAATTCNRTPAACRL